MYPNSQGHAKKKVRYDKKHSKVTMDIPYFPVHKTQFFPPKM